MAAPELAIDTASIVIKGSFSPSVLSPKELATQGLITNTQLSDATQKFATDEIAILETLRFRFLVNKDIMQLTAQQSDEFEPLRDLAVGILRIFTSEPVSVLGINRDTHFIAKSEDAWDALGDALTPKEIWEDLLEAPGMASLTIQGARVSNYDGYRQITVQPSNLVSQGVFVAHNDHYTLERSDNLLSSRQQLRAQAKRTIVASSDKVPVAIEILINEWEPSMDRATSAMERIAAEGRS